MAETVPFALLPACSWGTYCPGMNPEPDEGYSTCLGDLFSVAWMEDSEQEDSVAETLAVGEVLYTQKTGDSGCGEGGEGALGGTGRQEGLLNSKEGG